MEAEHKPLMKLSDLLMEQQLKKIAHQNHLRDEAVIRPLRTIPKVIVSASAEMIMLVENLAFAGNMQAITMNVENIHSVNVEF